MTGANVLAAIASFFLPGLGQLAQGRALPAFGWFVATIALWCLLLGWLGHILAAWEAAQYGIDVRPLVPQPAPNPPTP